MISKLKEKEVTCYDCERYFTVKLNGKLRSPRQMSTSDSGDACAHSYSDGRRGRGHFDENRTLLVSR